MNKQQLASKIWESANRMRSKIEANEYKDYILGFIFYKYLSETEVKYVRAQGGTPEDDWPYFDESDPVRSYSPLYVDAVVSNPPVFSGMGFGKQGGGSTVRRLRPGPEDKGRLCFSAS